nr:hypothetical protein [Tanacetum cinerariifolium]
MNRNSLPRRQDEDWKQLLHMKSNNGISILYPTRIKNWKWKHLSFVMERRCRGLVRLSHDTKGKAVKLSYQEDEGIDEDVTSIRKEKGLNDMKLKGDMYKKSDLYTGFQHFTDENDTDGKKSKMGASAGSSK